MIIVRAGKGDLPLLVSMRRQSACWLRARGIAQWGARVPVDDIAESVHAGTVYLIRHGDHTAATVTLDARPFPGLWLSEELAVPDLHLHRFIVLREYAGIGLGARILDWAGNCAAECGRRWVRVNASTDNACLHRYYLKHGFKHVRTVEGGGDAGEAGWLAQRAAAQDSDHGLTEQFSKPVRLPEGPGS
ncbi:GNAT family N-acetyltransferase [Streptomyces cyaneofuscatus]|uniref:GNAT family N-acetyltransferase n=1 Tax=Streptomyces cyaneofuscatus TaxID=66883 RepID=UPI0036C1A180